MIRYPAIETQNPSTLSKRRYAVPPDMGGSTECTLKECPIHSGAITSESIHHHRMPSMVARCAIDGERDNQQGTNTKPT